MIHTALAHLRAQWMGALALFLVIAGGTAYAANTIGSADVINESLLSEDIQNNGVASIDLDNNRAVKSADVANGHSTTRTSPRAHSSISMPMSATSRPTSASRTRSAGSARGDHLLVTPSSEDARADLSYSMQYPASSDTAVLQACNPTDDFINEGHAHFNLLVIDAQ